MLKDATKVEPKARLVAGPRPDTCRTKSQQSVASPTTDTVPTYQKNYESRETTVDRVAA